MGTPFISRQDVSDYVGVDVTADDGALIAIDSACETVRTITEQDFTATTSTIRVDGSGTEVILLPQRPVSAAGTVTVNGSAVTDYTVTDEGHLIRTAGTATTGGTVEYSTWAQNGYPTNYWPQGRQNVEVTYDHGYTGGTVPADVRMVALMIATRLVTQGVASSEEIGQVNVRYAIPSTDLTKGEQAILRRHKRSR